MLSSVRPYAEAYRSYRSASRKPLALSQRCSAPTEKVRRMKYALGQIEEWVGRFPNIFPAATLESVRIGADFIDQSSWLPLHRLDWREAFAKVSVREFADMMCQLSSAHISALAEASGMHHPQSVQDGCIPPPLTREVNFLHALETVAHRLPSKAYREALWERGNHQSLIDGTVQADQLASPENRDFLAKIRWRTYLPEPQAQNRALHTAALKKLAGWANGFYRADSCKDLGFTATVEGLEGLCRRFDEEMATHHTWLGRLDAAVLSTIRARQRARRLRQFVAGTVFECLNRALEVQLGTDPNPDIKKAVREADPLGFQLLTQSTRDTLSALNMPALFPRVDRRKIARYLRLYFQTIRPEIPNGLRATLSTVPLAALPWLPTTAEFYERQEMLDEKVRNLEVRIEGTLRHAFAP